MRASDTCFDPLMQEGSKQQATPYPTLSNGYLIPPIKKVGRVSTYRWRVPLAVSCCNGSLWCCGGVGLASGCDAASHVVGGAAGEDTACDGCVSPVQVRHAVFLHGYTEPMLLLLHEPEPTWPGRYRERHDTCQLSGLSLNFKRSRYPLIWSVPNLPSDCCRLMAVPRGGVLVLSQSLIMYHTQVTGGPWDMLEQVLWAVRGATCICHQDHAPYLSPLHVA